MKKFDFFDFFSKKVLTFLVSSAIINKLIRDSPVRPGVAQFGSALEWGSRGREFDSRHSDQTRAVKISDKTSDSYESDVFCFIFSWCTIGARLIVIQHIIGSFVIFSKNHAKFL